MEKGEKGGDAKESETENRKDDRSEIIAATKSQAVDIEIIFAANGASGREEKYHCDTSKHGGASGGEVPFDYGVWERLMFDTSPNSNNSSSKSNERKKDVAKHRKSNGVLPEWKAEII